MKGLFLPLVLAFTQYGSFAWALPHTVAFTTTQAPTTTTAARQRNLLDEPGQRASVTPWLDQVPRSTDRIADRATSASSPAPTATGVSPGQLVIASTKQSTLPPAICAFSTYKYGTGSSLEIWGCSNGYLQAWDSITFNSLDRCSSSAGGYFCIATYTSNAYTPTEIFTGDVQLSQGTLFSLDVSSYYGYSTYTYVSTEIETRSADTYTGESYTYFSKLTTVTETDLFLSTVYYLTETIAVYTNFPYTTTYSASTQTYTYTDHSYSYSYATSTSTYIACTGTPISSFYEPFDICWTQYFGPCLNSAQCSPVASGTGVQVLNLSQLQATLTGMTMTFSMTNSGTDTHLTFVDMYTSETLKPTGTASTVDTSPSGYFSLIKSHPPACVNAVNDTCTSLFSASQQCWSEAFPPGPQMCLCNSLATSNCTQICQSTPNDRLSYYNWALQLCNDYTNPNSSTSNATFASTWPEFQNRSTSIAKDLYPFPWSLAPHSTNHTSHCPTKALELTSFAINNIIIGIATFFLGKRTFIKWSARATKWLSKGAYGVAGSKSWPAISIFVVCLNVLANLINTSIVNRTSGFSTPGIGSLVLLWATRPRLTFIGTAIAPIQKEQSMYISIGITTLLSELILQTIGGVVFVQIINFFTKRGYMQINALYYVPGTWSVLLTFSAVLIWVISISFFYVYVIWKYILKAKVYTLIFPALWKSFKSIGKGIWYGVINTARQIIEIFKKCFTSRRDKRNEVGYDLDAIGEIQAQPYITKGWEGYLEQMGLGGDILRTVSWTYIFFLLPYVTQWLFWVGFVQFYEDRYCLPDLAGITVVWTVFDLLGVFLSATH